MEAVVKKQSVKNRKFIYDKLVVLFLIWTVFQDIGLSLLYRFIPSIPFVKFLLYAKDIAMVLLFAYSVIFKWKHKESKYFKIMVFYFFWVLFAFFIGVYVNKASVANAAASARGFILLACFVTIGYFISDKKTFKKKVIWFLDKFLIFVALIGILEFVLDAVVGTKGFWLNTVGFTDYMVDIKGQEGRLVDGLPGNFYGSYGGEFFSQKRLVSLWGGPLTAGYVLLLPFMYYFIRVLNGKKGYLKLFICVVSLILTYTRAIILLAGLAAFILIVFYKKHYKLLAVLIPIGIIFFVWKFDSIFTYIYDGSTRGHILAIVNSLKHISFFGSGFGSVGIYSDVGTESTYISCVGQMGIIGLILYLVLNWFLLRTLRRIYITTKDSFALTLYVIQIIYLFTGLISEQLIASTTISPFYIISGSFIANFKFVKKPAKVVAPAPKAQPAMEAA